MPRFAVKGFLKAFLTHHIPVYCWWEIPEPAKRIWLWRAMESVFDQQ